MFELGQSHVVFRPGLVTLSRGITRVAMDHDCILYLIQSSPKLERSRVRRSSPRKFSYFAPFSRRTCAPKFVEASGMDSHGAYHSSNRSGRAPANPSSNAPMILPPTRKKNLSSWGSYQVSYVATVPVINACRWTFYLARRILQVDDSRRRSFEPCPVVVNVGLLLFACLL